MNFNELLANRNNSGPSPLACYDEGGNASFGCIADVSDFATKLLELNLRDKKIEEIKEDIPQWVLADKHIEHYIKTGRGYLIGYIETLKQRAVLYYDGESLHEILYKNTPYYSMPLKYTVTAVSEDKIDPDTFMNHNWTFVTPSTVH